MERRVLDRGKEKHVCLDWQSSQFINTVGKDDVEGSGPFGKQVGLRGIFCTIGAWAGWEKGREAGIENENKEKKGK